MSIDEFIQQPGQKELLLKNAILDCIHVALPGEVVSYDSGTRTAKIQPVIRRWKSKDSPPILLDVPVFFLGNIVYPVEKGDECLVIFSDVCIDSWFENGGVSTPISARKHDLSDGFAFVGFQSKRKVTEGIDLVAKLEELESRIEALEGGNEDENTSS